MDPGKLKDRITFQKKKKSIGPVLSLDKYKNYTSVWAESRWIRGKNFYAARAANVKTDVEFVIRYREDLDETMRIKLDDRYFNVEGILPLDNTRMYLIIRAYEIKQDM